MGLGFMNQLQITNYKLRIILDMVLLTVVAFPPLSLKEKENIGGAYVNCWMNTDDTEFAKREATKYIVEKGWKAEEITDVSIYDAAEDLADGQLEYYNEALANEACYVFHTWPVGD